MTRKTFIIVRHAESIGNARDVHQGSEGGLTERGRAQAQILAERLSRFPNVDHIIASPYDRTRETATIIACRLGLDIQYSPHLIERKNPDRIIGSHRDDEHAVAIRAHIQENFNTQVRIENEEGFSELLVRTRLALAELLAIPRSTIVVVTHGEFLSFLTAAMLHGEHLTPRIVDAHQTRFGNASLSIFTHRTRRTWTSPAEVGWIIECLNDTSHCIPY